MGLILSYIILDQHEAHEFRTTFPKLFLRYRVPMSGQSEQKSMSLSISSQNFGCLLKFLFLAEILIFNRY